MSARDALNAYVVHESDEDQVEFERRLDAFAAEERAKALLEGADAIVSRLRDEGYGLDCVCDSCTPCLLRDYPDMLRALATAGRHNPYSSPWSAPQQETPGAES